MIIIIIISLAVLRKVMEKRETKPPAERFFIEGLWMMKRRRPTMKILKSLALWLMNDWTTHGGWTSLRPASLKMIDIWQYNTRHAAMSPQPANTSITCILNTSHQCLNCPGGGGLGGLNPPVIFSTHPTQYQILYWGVSTYSTHTIYITVWKDFDSQKNSNPPAIFPQFKPC